MALKKPLNHN